jgi:hypothetical protein
VWTVFIWLTLGISDNVKNIKVPLIRGTFFKIELLLVSQEEFCSIKLLISNQFFPFCQSHFHIHPFCACQYIRRLLNLQRL